MKRILFLSAMAAAAIITSCSNDADTAAKMPPPNVGTDSARFTSVQWLDSVQDFGTAVKGEKVKINFKCKNTGNKPLFMYYVRPGCGCTVASYTESAILPGGIGEVNAVYDSNHGTAGNIRKTITVQTNTFNKSPILIFTGTVTAPDSTKKS